MQRVMFPPLDEAQDRCLGLDMEFVLEGVRTCDWDDDKLIYMLVRKPYHSKGLPFATGDYSTRRIRTLISPFLQMQVGAA